MGNTMTYHAVALATDIPKGTRKSLTLNGAQILITNINRDYHAIQRKCPHMGADLGKGKLADAIVTCPKHEASFDVRTGKAVQPSKLLFFKFKTKDAKTYPVKIEGDTIMVGLE